MENFRKIRMIREIKGLKQDYLAQKLNVTQKTYSLMEQGKSPISIDQLHLIAETFPDLSPLNLVRF